MEDLHLERRNLYRRSSCLPVWCVRSGSLTEMGRCNYEELDFSILITFLKNSH
jgi:hypothetical protein